MDRIATISQHLTAGRAGGRLAGKVALVTGGGSGIGRATAKLFAAEGAKVFCTDWNLEGCEETVKEIRSTGGQAESMQFDASKEEDNKACVEKCVQVFGTLHILFANAGISSSTASPFWDIDLADFEETMKVNTLGVFLGFKHATRYMLQHKIAGSLLATASVAGIRSGAGPTHYSASKAAVINLVQTAANQLSGTGIRVNAICPGLIETGMTAPLFDHARARGTLHKVGQLNPLKRGGAPQEIAYAALFLASDESSYVNGQALPVCGGLSSSLPVVPGKMA